MKNEWKAWTEAEDNLLREIWAQPGALKWSIDKFPGRTINAIRFRGHRELGLPHRAKLRATTYSWVQEVVDAEFAKGFVGTVDQMAEITPASHQRIRQTIANGHGTKYYIKDWKRRTNGCDFTPVWAAGTEPDMPKPAPKSGAEISRKFRLNKKRRQGKFDPFSVLVNQVTGAEEIKMAPKKGAYGVRVFREAA